MEEDNLNLQVEDQEEEESALMGEAEEGAEEGAYGDQEAPEEDELEAVDEGDEAVDGVDEMGIMEEQESDEGEIDEGDGNEMEDSNLEEPHSQEEEEDEIEEDEVADEEVTQEHEEGEPELEEQALEEGSEQEDDEAHDEEMPEQPEDQEDEDDEHNVPEDLEGGGDTNQSSELAVPTGEESHVQEDEVPEKSELEQLDEELNKTVHAEAPSEDHVENSEMEQDTEIDRQEPDNDDKHEDSSGETESSSPKKLIDSESDIPVGETHDTIEQEHEIVEQPISEMSVAVAESVIEPEVSDEIPVESTELQGDESEQNDVLTKNEIAAQEQLPTIAQTLVDELSSTTVDQGVEGNCKPQEEMETDEKTPEAVEKPAIVSAQTLSETASAEEALPSLIESEPAQPADIEPVLEAQIIQPEKPIPQSEAAIPQPEAAISQPEAAISQPEAAIQQPEAAIPKSEASIAQPEAAIPQSEAAMPQPEAAMSQPEAAMSQPEAAMSQPEASIPRPEASILRPEPTIPQSETTISQPEATVPQPEATAPQSPVEEPLPHPVEDGLPSLEADTTNIIEPAPAVVENVAAAIQQPILMSDIQQALAPSTQQSSQSEQLPAEIPMETGDIQEGVFPSLDEQGPKIVKIDPGHHPTTDVTMMDDNDPELAAVLKEATNSLHLPDDQEDAQAAARMMSDDEKPCVQEPIVIKTKTEPGTETDDLSTLAAAAALDHGTNGIKPEEAVKKDPVWCDVGIIKGTSCFVGNYYEPGFTHDPEHETLTLDSLPDYTNSIKIELEPGTAYKFRVAAINSCGRGPWSEVSAFKTCLPGYPGAPSSIKISKSAEGAHLSWEPPSNPAGTIIEYSVCLAVRNSNQTVTEPGKAPQLAFVRVYNGPQNQTVVPNTSLAAAHIDTTSKPAIIFRIAAKNEKGFGPATQVRWLQDVVASPSGGLKTLPKKEPASNIPAKRPKLEDF